MSKPANFKVARTIIYITLDKAAGIAGFGQSLLSWMFKGGGWRPRESKRYKQIAVDDKKRKMLFLVLNNMSTGIYNDEVGSYFKKIGLPIQFKVEKMSISHTSPEQPQEIIVSGIGNEDKLVEWLKKNEYKHEVRHVAIQQ